MTPHCIYRVFEPEPKGTMTFDRHYLLYAAKGAIRLEAEGRTWLLHPYRAAWIRAGEPVIATIDHQMTCCSVLYPTGQITAPVEALTVFEMSPLARALILECRQWGPEDAPPDDHGARIFALLAEVCARLAATPQDAWIPSGRSIAVRRALAFAEAKLTQAPTFAEAARIAAVSERTLARRFEAETAMTWRQALRRMRLMRALEILATEDRPITQIAFDGGYTSLSAFNAAFRDFAGLSPSAYRNRIRDAK
ncbi:MAG: AraC family transcriptional regulator [Pseudomonadota bacterium]